MRKLAEPPSSRRVEPTLLRSRYSNASSDNSAGRIDFASDLDVLVQRASTRGERIRYVQISFGDRSRAISTAEAAGCGRLAARPARNDAHVRGRCSQRMLNCPLHMRSDIGAHKPPGMARAAVLRARASGMPFAG